MNNSDDSYIAEKVPIVEMLVSLRWEFVSRYVKLMLLMKYEIEENIALLAGLDLGLEGRNTLGTLPYGKYLKEGRKDEIPVQFPECYFSA